MIAFCLLILGIVFSMVERDALAGLSWLGAFLFVLTV